MPSAFDWAKDSPHFTRAEFRYPDAMDPTFIRWLNKLRKKVGFPLYVVSDYRPPARNAAAGGAKASAHMSKPCVAVDLGRAKGVGFTAAQRFALVFAARDLGCRRFGIYENGNVHLDLDPTKPQDVIWVAW